MTLIPIDRSSIRKNPDAGKTSDVVVTPDGPEVIHFYPTPEYRYAYVLTTITCDACGETFLHTKLREADDNPDYHGCPKCYWSLDVRFERIRDVMATA